jgi:hypothetical protein
MRDRPVHTVIDHDDDDRGSTRARELRRLQAFMKTERPYFDTIARRLIDTWLNRQSNR